VKPLIYLYSRGAEAASTLESPLLPAVRLYWGWQFAQAGWRKMHGIAKSTVFFASVNIPFPSENAHFVAGLEFLGGNVLILGIGSRSIALLLSVNMFLAYWTANRDAPVSFFSDPGKF
jgi:putative oxidoreductase